MRYRNGRQLGGWSLTTLSVRCCGSRGLKPHSNIVITCMAGIRFSNDLKWNRHIDEITAKANRKVGFLKRNVRVNSSTSKVKAYKGYFAPKVEYCSGVWEPRPGVENNGSYKIERIQHRAAQWCLRRYNNTSSVTNMLEDLGWRTLEQRRIDSRLMALFKITRGLLSVNSHGLLRRVMCMTRRSHSESFIPFQTSLSSEYLFNRGELRRRIFRNTRLH